jgi:hypothetical protein
LNETALRQSLTYSTQQEVVAHDGRHWTIRMVRSTDPINKHWDSVRGTAMMLARIGPWLRRQTRWNVQALPVGEDDWHNAWLVEAGLPRNEAIDAAIRAARQLVG